MYRKTCKVVPCGARAWHGEMCNLHALERVRTQPRPTAATKLEQGRQLLREKARELGIELSDVEAAVALVERRKARSPVT